MVAIAPLLAPCNAKSDVLNEMAGRFVEAERRASKLYREAYLADEIHEDLKQQLIALMMMGTDYEPQRFFGQKYELNLIFARTSLIDDEALVRFRLALRRDRSWKELVKEIFEGRMVYTFRPDAAQILAGARLSDRLRDLYQQCWTESKAPILEVVPI